MKTVRTTLFTESRNRSVYFDVEEGIRLCEERTGKKISETAAQIIRDYAPIINRAYTDGYKDGLEEGTQCGKIY